MNRSLQLAKLGRANVAPNPMVGAVLVYDHNIIGEGYHETYGKAHAEVNCINSVPNPLRHLIKESTLYVSLEPCNHFGKTPPCTELILQHGIRNVVIACTDPSEKVNGVGTERLRAGGVNVITGILEKEARNLNIRFFTFQRNKRPYVILKWAQSNNQKISGAGDSKMKISNELTDRLVHKWRSEESSIMVGSVTALVDNPSLTTRLWRGKNPVRIAVDKHLKIPFSHQLLDGSVETIIINTLKEEMNRSIYYHKTSESENLVQQTMQLLYEKKLNSLIVEGGAQLIRSFIESNCWDEARVITNTCLRVTDGISAPEITTGVLFMEKRVLNDQILFYKNPG